MSASAQPRLRPARARYVELIDEARGEYVRGQQQCVRLMNTMPGWLVMWGSGSRQFFAYPVSWPNVAMQRSAKPAELAELMLAAQMAGGWSSRNLPVAPAALNARGRPGHQV
ncbi:hypothetical protein GCM10027589_04490 [Actinocorallia lasiicapitis]